MEKINLAELLKNCPKGMELDCTMYDNVQFNTVQDENFYPIKIDTPEGRISLTKEGCYSLNPHCKCVIYPKGKTTWEGFEPPCKFKDGDIVATETGNWIGITKGGEKGCFIPTYCIIKPRGEFEVYFNRKEKWLFDRLATKKEEQKLFDAIKKNGYEWNAETKTLQKVITLKFKIGDKIREKETNFCTKILGIKWDQTETCYETLLCKIPVKDQDKFELIPNKFNTSTLKPFDKVLVRDGNNDKWNIDFFAYYRDSNDYQCMTFTKNQCIPYEENKHLLGTTDDCAEYYKTWE